MRKQYDGYVQYFSKHHGQIITAYCRSLFIGHCDSSYLVQHFIDFSKEMKWDNSYLLQLGMDGPSVNKAFEKKLSGKLHNEMNESFINVGTCQLYIVHNSFRKTITTFDFNFYDFFCNIHFFFKLSSGRREDFKDMENMTNISVQYALRHVEARWLSMKGIAVKITNQWENLCQYFLKFLPTQKTFKHTVRKTIRYQRIENALESVSTKVYLHS